MINSGEQMTSLSHSSNGRCAVAAVVSPFASIATDYEVKTALDSRFHKPERNRLKLCCCHVINFRKKSELIHGTQNVQKYPLGSSENGFIFEDNLLWEMGLRLVAFSNRNHNNLGNVIETLAKCKRHGNFVAIVTIINNYFLNKILPKIQLNLFLFQQLSLHLILKIGTLNISKMSNSFRPHSGYSNVDRNSASLPIIKMRLENEFIRKREAETRRTETARSNNRYFQNCNLQTEKFGDWTSPRNAQLSQRQSKLRETEIDVENRRVKLKNLYQADRLKEEEAVKKIIKDEEKKKWENMKEKVQHFRRSKSAKLSEFLENNEHEKWKSTNDSFRVFESELRKQQQKEMWTIQLQQREEEKARLMEEKKREAAQMEHLVQEEKRRYEIEQQMELEKKQQWKKDLDAQVQQLRVMDSEANEKRREHERLIAEATALEAIKEEIQKKEGEIARRKLNGEFLTKQHLAKLRQRSKEVTADLEREMSFVEKLTETDRSPKKEKTRQDIMQFLELLENHRQIEKERLQQNEFLFQEEAKKLWQKRESEWEAERLARKKLMEDVITIQKKQIDERLLEARQERERLLLDREELVRSLESYHNQMKMKEMETKNKQFNTKVDLLAQIDRKQRSDEEFIKLEEQKRKHQEIMDAAHNHKHWSIAMDKLKL